MRLLPLGATALCLFATGCAATVVDGGAGGATSATASSTSSTTASASATSSTGAGGAACDAPSTPATFETGTGETCFERFAPLQTVPVMQGPQGGFHIWTAIGCSDCGLQPSVEYGIKDPATMTYYAGTYPSEAILDLSGTAWPQKAGLTSFLPGVVYDPTTQLPKGTHVIVSARVIDGGGNTVHLDEHEVILGDVMEWNPPCDPDPTTCGKPGGTPCCTFGG